LPSFIGTKSYEILSGLISPVKLHLIILGICCRVL